MTVSRWCSSSEMPKANFCCTAEVAEEGGGRSVAAAGL